MDTKTLATKHQNHMVYVWQYSTTFIRLDIGRGKVVSLEIVRGGSVIVMSMQLPSNVEVMKVNWGFVYPTFGHLWQR